MTAISRLLLSRFAIPIAGLLSLAVIAVIYFRFPAFYALVAKIMILLPGQKIFADWESVLWSIKCWSDGANVYVANACSPPTLGPGFNYSPLWLRLSFLGPAVNWKSETAIPIIILFYLSLATLPPAKTLRDQAILLFATLSSAIFLGLERANVDLILFLFVVVALNLRVLTLPFRLAGYALLIFAGLLKFYPFMSLIIVLRERVSVLVAVALASVVALVTLIVTWRQELSLVAGHLPGTSYFNLQFGSADLPVALGVTVANILQMASHQDTSSARAVGATVAHAALPLLTVMALLGAIAMGWRCRLPGVLAHLSDRETDYLVVGAALTCGCFFTVNSHVFRGIFLLLALPGLATLSRQEASPLGGRIFGTASALIPFVLWQPFFDMCLIVASRWKSPRGNNDDPYNAFPGFTPDYWLWLASELAWWWIITVLLAILGAFVLNSDAWALLRRTLRLPAARVVR
jgi:hypothetical protein